MFERGGGHGGAIEFIASVYRIRKYLGFERQLVSLLCGIVKQSIFHHFLINGAKRLAHGYCERAIARRFDDVAIKRASGG